MRVRVAMRELDWRKSPQRRRYYASIGALSIEIRKSRLEDGGWYVGTVFGNGYHGHGQEYPEPRAAQVAAVKVAKQMLLEAVEIMKRST
jgi:hypothetical protein